MNIYKFFVLSGIWAFSVQAVDVPQKILNASTAGALGTIAVISACALKAPNAGARFAGFVGTLLAAAGTLNGVIFYSLNKQ